MDKVVSEGEVIVIRIEGGGPAGRAFFGRLVEMMTGLSGSRRCEATEGRGRLVPLLDRVVIELVEGKWRLGQVRQEFEPKDCMDKKAKEIRMDNGNSVRLM